MFEVRNNAQVDINRFYASGNPTASVRVDNAQLSMTNATIIGTDASPTILPRAEAAYNRMSNSELRTLAASLEARLGRLQVTFDATTRQRAPGSLPNATMEQKLEIFRQDSESRASQAMAADMLFQHEMLPLLRNLVATVVERTGPMILPPLSMAEGIEVYRQRRSILRGSFCISSGMIGGSPQSIADLCNELAATLSLKLFQPHSL